MKSPDIGPPENTGESFPTVSIDPREVFSSKTTPIFESDIIDAVTGKKIGHVGFHLNHRDKIIIVQSVVIDRRRQGYGVSLYLLLQSLYPEYQLRSSDQMTAKTIESQEKPNAVYLWEKLVRLGYAEKDALGGFRMKINSGLGKRGISV